MPCPERRCTTIVRTPRHQRDTFHVRSGSEGARKQTTPVVVPALQRLVRILSLSDGLHRANRNRIAFPAGFRYVVAPELLLSQTPLNLDDAALRSTSGVIVPPPTTQLTDGSFHVARARLSKVMHRFFGVYLQMTRGDPARHNLAWETDEKLEELLQDTPFSPKYPAHSPNRSWHYPATHLFRSLIAHKRLLLFREFFALA